MARVSIPGANRARTRPSVTQEPYEFKWVHLLIYFVLTVGAFVSALPFLYMLSTSLMTLGRRAVLEIFS
jgi:ABC-type glycerol-3-phosphate transport system permease component